MQFQIVSTCLSILVIGCGISYLVFDNQRLSTKLGANDRFYAQAKIQSDAIEYEIHKNLESVKALKSLFSVTENISAPQFQSFTKDFITTNSAIQALEWIPQISASERAEFEQSARGEGFPEFKITERLIQGTMTKAAQRDIYYPVKYVNPLKGNKAALGFDLGSNPRRRAAIDKAVISNSIIASEAISLVQETDRQVGILIFNPVYRSTEFTNPDETHLVGLSLLVLNIVDVLKSATNKLENVLDFKIMDNSNLTDTETLFESNPTLFKQTLPALTFISTISVADRTWNITFYPSSNPALLWENNNAVQFLITGIVLTFFTTLFFGNILLQKSKAKAEILLKNNLLQESVDRFSSAVEGSSAGLWEWPDITKNNAYWSPRFYHLLGYRNSEILPRMRTFLRLVYPEDRKKILFQIRRILRDKSNLETDIRLMTKSEYYRWFKLTGTYSNKKSTGSRQLVGSIQDIHEGKTDHFNLVDSISKVNQINVEFKALVDTAVDAIITIDKYGSIEHFNPAAEKLFGYKKDEVIGQNVKILMPMNHAVEHDNYLRNYLNTHVKKIIGVGREVIGKRKSGIEFPLELSVGEMSWNKGGYVGILRDITDRKDFENKIKKRTEELARSNKDLAQFAYVASHDLKAPLRGIDHLAGWIEDKVGEHMDEECTSYMDLLRGRINRLDAHLSSLLQYSRIGRKNTEIETIDLNFLLKNTVDLLEKDNFQITVEELPTIKASKTEITILFQNLIDNAIKHHDKEEGNILITGSEHPDCFEISVHDDGPGIPENMIGKAFALFQTLKPRDDLEGSGMGLAFIKKITDRNNASISVEKSKFDRGTAFIIRWPKRP